MNTKIIEWGPRYLDHIDVVVSQWSWLSLKRVERTVRVQTFLELGVRRAYYTDTFDDVGLPLLRRVQNLELYTKRA